jgi:hypothetical protein
VREGVLPLTLRFAAGEVVGASILDWEGLEAPSPPSPGAVPGEMERAYMGLREGDLRPLRRHARKTMEESGGLQGLLDGTRNLGEVIAQGVPEALVRRYPVQAPASGGTLTPGAGVAPPGPRLGDGKGGGQALARPLPLALRFWGHHPFWRKLPRLGVDLRVRPLHYVFVLVLGIPPVAIPGASFLGASRGLPQPRGSRAPRRGSAEVVPCGAAAKPLLPSPLATG